jgi:hypothetical protein
VHVILAPPKQVPGAKKQETGGTKKQDKPPQQPAAQSSPSKTIS